MQRKLGTRLRNEFDSDRDPGDSPHPGGTEP